MTIWEIAVGIGAGLIAGCINTLAGNGSALTLAVLMEFFGLPANIANGTNRLGIVAQSWATTFSFIKEGRFDFHRNYQVLLWPVLGAFIGIYLAIIISSEGFRLVYKYLLLLMLVVILIKPKRWIQTPSGENKTPMWIIYFIYFLIGIYGGFIQMGMGIFALATFVLVGKMDIIKANVLKSYIVAVYTTIALLVFAWQGLVHWGFGITLAIGQMAGGWTTAVFASRSPRAGIVAYYLLIICVIGAILKVFGWV
ncbi:sulfite exporter TauE/SafE family protein [Membranihabitans maritimus]|uniref:sulfite exporter TauE/SafE family protein n=1 Tax=Membranihabitans maritimus TaxID=2904244 RepID=UPI001F2AE0B1|nr:sulfite exporter TauE/SafE family protein [Membranihabitans maritimus]